MDARPPARSRAPRLAALVPLLALCACAIGPRPVVCPARGGPPWREFRSAHFEIFSDASPERVASLAGQLEQLRAQLLVGMAGEGAEVEDRVRVLALDDPRAFGELAGPQAGGYFGHFGFEERPTVVIPSGWGGAEPETVAHELAHHLSRYFYPRQPLWFAEGLAEFYQSVASRDPAARGRFGAVDAARSYWLAHTPPIDPRALLTATKYPVDGYRARFHLSSWLVYHWLWNERSADFTAFQERLARLEPPAKAWLAAFPDLDPSSDAAMAGMASLVEAYRRRGRIATWKVEAAFDGRVAEVREVPSADVHDLLRTARRNRGASRAEADRRDKAELEEQLAEDPLHPDGLVDLALREKRSAAPELRRSVAARPEDWRGWYWLGVMLRRRDVEPAERAEAEAATRRALALAPDEPVLLNDLAWRLAQDGRSGEALPLARRAVALAPWNGAFIDTLAFVAADLGRCREALSLQDRAVDLLPQSPSLRERLADYTARCGEAPGGAAPAPPAASSR